MATSTTNLGLIKPDGTDKIRIAQINQNMDTLDSKIGAVGNTDLQSQVSTNNAAIAKLSGSITASSLSAFETALNNKIATMSDGGIESGYCYPNFSTAPFDGSNGTYVISRRGSENVSAHFFLGTKDVSGYYYSGSWHWDSTESNLTKASVSDANANLANGAYYTTSASQNVPSGIGVLFNIVSGGNATRRLQICIDTSNAWIRFGAISGSSLSWETWKKFAFTT